MVSHSAQPFKPDDRFFATAPPLALVDAVKLIDAEIVHAGAGKAAVSHVAPIGRASDGAVAFAESAKLLEADLHPLQPALLLTTPKFADRAVSVFAESAVALCAAPKAGFAALGRALHESRMRAVRPDGVASTATIAPSAKVASSAVIMDDAVIGERAEIGPFAVIGPGVTIGAGTQIGGQCSVSHADIGDDCVISAGVRIGEAGFGYVPGPDGAMPIPQLGRVIIGSRVDIGANSTVDRGALEDTIIGDGTKIDNLVQIAHNCVIGRHVLIASQTGVSGSCVIGDGVMIGGQAGMADHLVIGAGAVITAKSGLMKDVPAGEKWGGIPAKPAREWMKDVATISRLAKKGK